MSFFRPRLDKIKKSNNINELISFLQYGKIKNIDDVWVREGASSRLKELRATVAVLPILNTAINFLEAEETYEAEKLASDARELDFEKTQNYLLGLMTNSDPRKRLFAIKNLDKEKPNVQNEIIKYISDPDDEVAIAALLTLERDKEKYSQKILETFKNSRPSIKQYAAMIIGPQKEVIEYVKYNLNGNNNEFTWALDWISWHYFLPFVDFAIKRLEEESFLFNKTTAGYLSRLYKSDKVDTNIKARIFKFHDRVIYITEHKEYKLSEYGPHRVQHTSRTEHTFYEYLDEGDPT